MKRVYLTGYAGRKPETLKAIVERMDAVVVDIRYSPRSRVLMWNKASLIQLLGWRYVHVPALGNLNYKSGEKIVIANLDAGAAMLSTIAGETLILLCVCRQAATCHRTVVAEGLRDSFDVLGELPEEAWTDESN